MDQKIHLEGSKFKYEWLFQSASKHSIEQWKKPWLVRFYRGLYYPISGSISHSIKDNKLFILYTIKEPVSLTWSRLSTSGKLSEVMMLFLWDLFVFQWREFHLCISMVPAGTYLTTSTSWISYAVGRCVVWMGEIIPHSIYVWYIIYLPT